MRYTLLMLAVLIVLTGCGTPASQPTSTAAAQAPTGIPAATAVPTAVSEPPEVPADPALAPQIVARVEDGSLHALDGVRDMVLADPTSPGQALPWALAPDGQRVAVVTYYSEHPINENGSGDIARDAELWVVNIDGSAPRKLLDLLSTGPKPVTVHSNAGTLNHVLKGPPSFASMVVWSDASSIIVLSEHAQYQPDLYRVNADSGAVERLTNTPDLEFDLYLSPDRQTLAFVSVVAFDPTGTWSQAALSVLPLAGAPEALPLVGPDGGPLETIDVLDWSASGIFATGTTGQLSSTTLVHFRSFQELQTTTIDEPLAWAELTDDPDPQLHVETFDTGAPNRVWLWDGFNPPVEQ